MKTTKKTKASKLAKTPHKPAKKVAKKVTKKVTKKVAKTVTKKVAKKTPSKKLTPLQISDMAVDSLIISMNEQFKKIETEEEASLIEYITFTTLGDKILEQFGRKTFDQYVKDIIEDFQESK